MFFCSHLNDKSEKMHLAQVHMELNNPRSFACIETDNECTRTIFSWRPGQGTTEGSPAPVWTKSYLVSWELGAVLRLISITRSLCVTCPYIRNAMQKRESRTSQDASRWHFEGGQVCQSEKGEWRARAFSPHCSCELIPFSHRGHRRNIDNMKKVVVVSRITNDLNNSIQIEVHAHPQGNRHARTD